MSKESSCSVCAVILAAGSGRRMNSEVAKQSLLLCGETVLHRAVRAFDECESVDSIVVVCRACDVDLVREDVFDLKKVYKVVEGGETRAESAKAGFDAIPSKSDYVAIHDAARCLITPTMIERVIQAACRYGAATAATQVTDSLKRADNDGFIDQSVPRDGLYSVQTPQIFAKDLYERAIAIGDLSASVTDDNMLVQATGAKILCVDCGRDNIKITAPEDLLLAEFLIKRRNGDG